MSDKEHSIKRNFRSRKRSQKMLEGGESSKHSSKFRKKKFKEDHPAAPAKSIDKPKPTDEKLTSAADNGKKQQSSSNSNVEAAE